MNAPPLFQQLCEINNALEHVLHALALPEACPLRDALEALVTRLDEVIDKTLDEGMKETTDERAV